MASLLLSPAQYDAQTLRDAIKGPGTNEKKLDEILITRNKQVSLLEYILSTSPVLSLPLQELADIAQTYENG